MPTERDVRTLREMVRLNPVCAQRFDEALRLANGLFKRDDCIQLPYYTPHDATHCEAVEKYLNQIIWGSAEIGPCDFLPTPEEAMYLLSAAWLHDIGMLYGIFHGENAEDLAYHASRIHTVRNEHEMRSLKYIQNEWHLECWPSSQAKTWLSNICAFHRRHRPIGEFEPVQILSELDGRPIRLVVLAALLRLADACHEDQSRAE